MSRDRALKIVLVAVGLLFSAGIYPITTILWRGDESGYTVAMLLSIYVALGILLLMAVPKPSAHRSLISFAAWSCLAHAVVMTVMAFRDPSARGYLLSVAFFIIIGLPLIVLAPPKQSLQKAARTEGT